MTCTWAPHALAEETVSSYLRRRRGEDLPDA